MGELTKRIVAQATAPPTDEALAVLRLSALDWIACGIAGVNEPVSKHVSNMLDAEGGAPQSTCFDGASRPARATALYNGTASHALDYDDTHFAHIGHISVGVLPAALAMAEYQGVTIEQFLKASLAGCEAAIRMGVALGRTHYQGGFHQTATSGAFGATLAASLLATKDTDVRAHALGLASTQAAGLKAQFGTMGKPYNAGLSASTGVQAALLATHGMTSNVDGWDGPGGFLETHMASGNTADEGFLIPAVSHKFHACCHGLHACLEALRMLTPIDPARVTNITVTTHPRWMTVCNQQNPTTDLGAKFSYQAVIAMTLHGLDTAETENFSESTMARPDMRATMAKVAVKQDAALTEMQSRVAVTTDKETLTASHDLNQQLPYDQRLARIHDKAVLLMGEQRSASIWDLIANRTNQPVAKLTETFRANWKS